MICADRISNNIRCRCHIVGGCRALLLLMVLLFFSCSYQKPYPPTMQQAENCIVQFPDSALSYLELLNTTIKQEPEETQMYYALLTIKAKDKLYIPHTSDSLIKTITHFYEHYGDPDKLMEAYFYLGSTYRDMNDAPRAVEAFQHAADVGKNSNRYDLLARIYGQMGTRLAYQSLYMEALETYKKSLHYYQISKDKEGVATAFRSIARMYEVCDNRDSSIYYYEIAYKKAVEAKSKLMEDNILSELGCFYIDLKLYDSAKLTFSKISELAEQKNVFCKLGVMYQATSQGDSARYYFVKATEKGNIYAQKYAYEALSKMEESIGNYSSALNYAYKSLELVDSIDAVTKTEAVSKVHALYNYSHIKKENNELVSENKKKQEQNYQLIIVLLSVVSLSVCYILYIRRRKSLMIEQERKLRQLKEEQYASSLALIDTNKNKINSLEEQLLQTEIQKETFQTQLVQAQKELLEASNRKILAARNEKDLLELTFKKSDIYLLFHQIVNENELKITDKDWRNLQVAIDSTYSNFTNK